MFDPCIGKIPWRRWALWRQSRPGGDTEVAVPWVEADQGFKSWSGNFMSYSTLLGLDFLVK